MWENRQKSKYVKFWWIIKILCLGYPPPMEKVEKSKNDK